MMFSDLDTAEPPPGDTDSGSSIIELLVGTAEADRRTVIADHVRQIAAAVFDCAVTDIKPDDMLDDIGLDSMMAMDFRVRINTAFSVDVPVLEILRGVSVNSLSDWVLAELHSIHGDAPATTEEASPAEPSDVDDDVKRLMDGLSDAELRDLLAELDARATEPETGGAHS